MTAARGLHEGLVDVTVLLEQVVAGHRHADHRVQGGRFVGPAQRALREVVEQSVDHQFHFADDDRVGVLKRLLRHEARMDAAHHHRHAFGAEAVGDFVTAVDIARHRGNPDHVGLQIEVDRLDIFVGQHDFVLIARNDRGDRQQAGERRIKSAVEVERARGERVGFRVDEVDNARPHRCLPPKCPSNQPKHCGAESSVVRQIKRIRRQADQQEQAADRKMA